MNKVKSFWSKIKTFFKNQTLLTFETAFGFFCVYTGIVGLMQFGVVPDLFTRTLGLFIANIFNVGLVLAGLGMYVGLGTNKRNVEAVGLITVATSLIIRSFITLYALGMSPLVFNSYILNGVFITACIVRLLNINRVPINIELINLDALVISDIDGKIVFWPQSAIDMFGYSEAEAVHQPLTILIPERFHAAYNAGIISLKTSTNKAYILNKPIQLVAKHKNGFEFPVRLIIRSWQKDQTVCYVGTIRDERVWKKLLGYRENNG